MSKQHEEKARAGAANEHLDAPAYAEPTKNTFLDQSLAEIDHAYGSATRPIQRRAGGGCREQSLNEIAHAYPIERTARDDGGDGASAREPNNVQQIAAAGVAGGGQPLPFADTIQRSFGRHDVSQVKAHVGGRAADAAKTMGAVAYATGNDVAFASPPDLHTAAHEAAHVVQQRNGGVSFKGVGPADDAHERQADDVADAVVAGRSAEPLLERASQTTTNARSAGAIQRRTTSDRASAPPPTSDRSPDELRVEVIRASLRNAQHEIAKWDGAPDPVKVIIDTRAHLAEASATLGGLPLQPAHLETLQPQMDATTRAIEEVVRMHGDRPPVAQLKAQAVQLRTRLRLDPDPMTAYGAGRVGASTTGNHDEAGGVGPVIDLIRIEAEAAYEQLVAIDLRKAGDDEGLYEPDERGAVIAAVTGKLQHHVLYAHAILDEHRAAARTLKPRLVAASAPIQQIRAWIFSRPDNAKLLPLFDRVLHEVDALRATAGLGSLAKEPTPPLARAAMEGAKKEEEAVASAQKQLFTAIDLKFRAFQVGADTFEAFAKKAPPAPKTSFWEELAKGVLISVIGNVIGPAVSALVAANARAMTATSLGIIAGTTTDSVQAIAGKIAEDAFAQTASTSDKLRNVALFKQGLVLTQARCVSQAQNCVTKRIEARSISAAELLAMRKDIEKSSVEQVVDMTFQHAAHGFALLTSQLGLGVQDLAGERVTVMDEYFGAPEFTNRFGDPRVGRKDGTAGVGRLSVSVFDDGTISGYRIEKFALHGMVGELANAVLAHAGYQLDKLALPLEIEIEPPGSGRDGTAVLAVDERGELRATKGWNNMQGAHDRAWNADFYASPDKLWQMLRQAVVPKGIVEKG